MTLNGVRNSCAALATNACCCASDRRTGTITCRTRKRPPTTETTTHADADQRHNEAQFVEQGMERVFRSACLDDYGDVRAVFLADPDGRGQDARVAGGRREGADVAAARLGLTQGEEGGQIARPAAVAAGRVASRPAGRGRRRSPPYSGPARIRARSCPACHPARSTTFATSSARWASESSKFSRVRRASTP